MKRANRIAVQTIENGYRATFYRTHKTIGQIDSMDTAWQANADANSTTNRESFRSWVCEHSTEWDIEWDSGKAMQAWDREYNT